MRPGRERVVARRGRRVLRPERKRVERAGRRELVVTPRGPWSGVLRWGRWRVPCAIGRGGVAADKREGDRATPAGAHRIGGAMWRADRRARPKGWPPGAALAIGPSMRWCDDPADPRYNRLVRDAGFGAERLRRGDPLYDVVLVLDWNAEAVPGRGSAIFVHRWRRPGHPTEGCVALPPAALRRLADRVRPGDLLVTGSRGLR